MSPNTAVRSIGFDVDAAFGRSSRSRACRPADSSGSTNPSAASTPVAITAMPPPSERTATRRPVGRVCISRPCAASISSSGVATSSAPASPSAADTTRRADTSDTGVRLRGARGRLARRRQHDHRLAGLAGRAATARRNPRPSRKSSQ